MKTNIQPSATREDFLKLNESLSKSLELGLKGLELTMKMHFLETGRDVRETENRLTKRIDNLDKKMETLEKGLRTIWRFDLGEFKEEIRKELKEKFGLMSTKDEFFTRMDKVMGELQTTRDQQVLLSARSSDHEDRIEVLEQSAGLAAA